MRLIRILTYSLLLLCCGLPLSAQTDSTAADSMALQKPGRAYPMQLRFGIDLARPVFNTLLKNRQGFEVSADYSLKKEWYAVAEGGWGNMNYSYPDLSYRSANTFLRVGMDKSLLPRMHANDWDMVFAGFRYGAALIRRGEGSYVTTDSLWGQTSGTIPEQYFSAHWVELTGGMRVEVFRGMFLGWNVRGKLLLNKNSFSDLAPHYLAGYGKGDRGSAFDFNFYLCYAFRYDKGRQVAEKDFPE